MKDSGKTIILAVILSILLFFAGLFLYSIIVELLLSETDRVFYQDVEAKGLFGSSFMFSFLLALMPIFILCIWNLCRVNKKSDRISIASIVIVFTFLAVFIRQQILAAYIKRLSHITETNLDDIKISYPLNRLNFESYMLAGLCTGCVLAYMLYRRTKKYTF